MGIIKSVFQGIFIAVGIVVGFYLLSYVEVSWVESNLRHITERIGEFLIRLGK